MSVVLQLSLTALVGCTAAPPTADTVSEPAATTENPERLPSCEFAAAAELTSEVDYANLLHRVAPDLVWLESLWGQVLASAADTGCPELVSSPGRTIAEGTCSVDAGAWAFSGRWERVEQEVGDEQQIANVIDGVEVVSGAQVSSVTGFSVVDGGEPSDHRWWESLAVSAGGFAGVDGAWIVTTSGVVAGRETSESRFSVTDAAGTVEEWCVSVDLMHDDACASEPRGRIAVLGSQLGILRLDPSEGCDGCGELVIGDAPGVPLCEW